MFSPSSDDELNMEMELSAKRRYLRIVLRRLVIGEEDATLLGVALHSLTAKSVEQVSAAFRCSHGLRCYLPVEP